MVEEETCDGGGAGEAPKQRARAERRGKRGARGAGGAGGAGWGGAAGGGEGRRSGYDRLCQRQFGVSCPSSHTHTRPYPPPS
jgi:hypothetical protein